MSDPEYIGDGGDWHMNVEDCFREAERVVGDTGVFTEDQSMALLQMLGWLKTAINIEEQD